MAVPALCESGMRKTPRVASDSPRPWKSESVRLWRLLAGPVCASLRNGLESILGQCSASAALSTA
jgi:hypothetical protein